PLVIDVAEWNSGDPYAATFNWFRLGLSAGAYVVLLAIWPFVKTRNRQTRRVLDQTIHRFGDGPKNKCKDLISSGDITSERRDMTPTDESNTDQIYERKFVDIVRNHRRALYLAARKFTGNHEEAEDVVQDVLLEILKRRSLGEVIKNPVGYVHDAVVHKA